MVLKRCLIILPQRQGFFGVGVEVEVGLLCDLAEDALDLGAALC